MASALFVCAFNSQSQFYQHVATTSSHNAGYNRKFNDEFKRKFSKKNILIFISILTFSFSHVTTSAFTESEPPPIDTDRRSDPSTSNSKTPTSGVSSQHSSLSAPNKYHPGAHPARKLKSQYPRGDSENHVEYILVASFDIDKGPIMEHQYPVAITGDEHMLAELMLPDQAHVRNQDWTIFFLHKDTSQDEQEAEDKAERKRLRKAKKEAKAALFESGNVDTLEDMNDNQDEESEDDEPEGGEGPPLIYVLNLVNTKQDKTAKRGAVVKAMAISTSTISSGRVF
ncbi:hypothetical protein DID88_007412 [Monilinia fructigena]|uniref:Arf3-interacting protein 1 N-terminal domain-containing protein n=1 Tax=Monilinia fructigena TaxID=38457 RepID=A0A395J895_9HELO|nr:hypothetical protein DID88_007412 [Monilinia fructigena]